MANVKPLKPDWKSWSKTILEEAEDAESEGVPKDLFTRAMESLYEHYDDQGSASSTFLEKTVA